MLTLFWIIRILFHVCRIPFFYTLVSYKHINSQFINKLIFQLTIIMISTNFQNKHKADNLNCEEKSVHRTSTDIENRLRNADNGNNRTSNIENRRNSTVDITDVDRRNGNESITTTETNSDSLIVASSDTPPVTINSSPNTRSRSPSHTGLNTSATNVNGMLKKNALKAALSLDPSALCRGTIPYEKIAFSPPPQRSSTPGSMEIKKVI